MDTVDTTTTSQAAPTAAITPPEVQATPPVPEVEVTTETKTDVPAEAVSEPYAITGDAGLDIALSFLYTNGIYAENPAVLAAEVGDFGPLEALLKERGIDNYERYLSIGEQAYRRMQADYETRENQKVADMLTVIPGGEERWTQVTAWAAQTADPSEQETVNAALKGGGLVAKAMASFMHTMYQNAQMTSPHHDMSAAARVAPTSGGSLNAEQYRQEFAKLMKNGIAPAKDNPELIALNKRFVNK